MSRHTKKDLPERDALIREAEGVRYFSSKPHVIASCAEVVRQCRAFMDVSEIITGAAYLTVAREKLARLASLGDPPGKTRARTSKKEPTEAIWKVLTGRPSSHQQRAGHSHSGEMHFDSETEARKYAARFASRNPNEPISVVAGTQKHIRTRDEWLHAQVSMSWKGRDLLGDVRDLYRDDLGNMRLCVTHFNREPWPVEPIINQVEVLG